MSENTVIQKKDDFIMLPTSDFCFKELMQNSKVRKGIISALLGISPEEIAGTKLMPTSTTEEYPDGKLGILDVLIKLENGTQVGMEMQVAKYDYWTNRILFYLCRMFTGQIEKGDTYDKLKKCIHVSFLDFIHFENDYDFYRKITLRDEKNSEYTDLLELHILELKKLPPEEQNENGLLKWTRFLNGKCREDFEKMAEKDEYIDEAYELLKKMSADERKRLAYEAREKAVRDYNTQIKSSLERGEERLNSLNRQLLKMNRMNDLVKAVSNKEYRQKLYLEFGL